MTIQDKIGALPIPAGPFFKPHSMWLQAKLRRAEAERDLALEVLRKAKEYCTNCQGNGAYLDADGLWNDCRYCDEARAVIAACGGESRE
jgi:hypothetical protein